MTTRTPRWLEPLASTELTLFCLGLAMIVIFFGTLAQVHMGTFAAQKEFFDRFWVYGTVAGIRMPIFPGGLTVGLLWMVNLLAAFAVRFKFRRRDAGILLSHLGVIVLLLGQLLTQTLAIESQMPVEVGQTRNFSEAFRDTEIALIRASDPNVDEVTSIPYAIFSRRSIIRIPKTSLSLVIKKLYRNAQLAPAPIVSGTGAAVAHTQATAGIGTQIAVQEMPPVSSDDEVNTVTAYVEVLESGKNLGTWLLSTGLGAPQPFNAGGQVYEIYLRHRRYYTPYSLTLKEFRHDRYPGTDIPKNFSSLVHLNHPAKNESRDVLIYMNHPLRYEGRTFYQASFGKGDRLSVFQVVQNPVWLTPYVSCAMVITGLAIQFMTHLLGFLRKRNE